MLPRLNRLAKIEKKFLMGIFFDLGEFFIEMPEVS